MMFDFSKVFLVVLLCYLNVVLVSTDAKTNMVAPAQLCTDELWSQTFDKGGLLWDDYLAFLLPHFAEDIVGVFGDNKVKGKDKWAGLANQLAKDWGIHRVLFQLQEVVLNRARRECSFAFQHTWSTAEGLLLFRRSIALMKYNEQGKVNYLSEFVDEEKLELMERQAKLLSSSNVGKDKELF